MQEAEHLIEAIAKTFNRLLSSFVAVAERP